MDTGCARAPLLGFSLWIFCIQRVINSFLGCYEPTSLQQSFFDISVIIKRGEKRLFLQVLNALMSALNVRFNVFASPKWCQLWPFTFHLTKIPIFILLSGICILQLQAETQPYLKKQVEHQAELLAQPRDHSLPKPMCHTQCSPPWKSHGVTCALYVGDKCNPKDTLEHGRHPGVYVSPSLCLYAIWESSMECVGQRALLIPGKQQHMGSICITSDRNLTAAFKSYTKILPPS